MSYRDNVSNNPVVESTPPSANYTEERGISFYKFGTMEGVIAGVAMSILFVVVELASSTGEPHIFTQFAINAVLLAIIAYALNKYKEYLPDGSVFRSGMLMGAYISGLAGLIIAVANIILTLFVPTMGISLFGMSALGLGDALLISFGMFLITFVNGMIMTFICLQFLKEKSSS